MKQLFSYRLVTCLLLVGVTSCLKESPMNIDAGKSIDLVEFANTGSNVASASSTFPGFYSDLGTIEKGQSGTFNLNVDYSGPTEAPEDITVNIGIDTAALSKYNTENGTGYVVPDPSVFNIPSSVVIKKGTRLGQAPITITNNDLFSFDESYALPLKIMSVSGGTVSANFGSAIYSFGVRNIYDGHYSIKGYSLRAGDDVKTGNFEDPHGMDLVTQGANILQFNTLQVWADLTGVGVGNPVITVNADNSVTLSSSGLIYNAPGYDSRYDPATKTFYISFSWGGGPTARLATDTLTYIEPRP